MNTQFTPYGDIVELFENYIDMEDWFLKVGLVENLETLNTKEQKKYYEEILNYRVLLRENFQEYLEQKISFDNLIEVTNNILLENNVHPKVIKHNDSFILEYISNKGKYNILLTKIAIEFLKLVISKEFKYLKNCDNHKCCLYFIDTSKNHSRRWCSMEICGNRSKVNSFAKRKKTLTDK